MFKELESDIEGFKRPNHGHLVGWARQGNYLYTFDFFGGYFKHNKVIGINVS